MKKIKFFASKAGSAFSLIEILVSLIIISLVVSAFVPIATKKLKASDITIGSFSAPVSSNCDQFSTETQKCLICSTDECTLCQSQLSLNANQYVDPSKGCTPKNCTDFGSNCATCNKQGCSSCLNANAGFYADLDDGCKAKACSTEFGLGCSTCTKDYCTSCKGGYGFNALAHTCKQCDGGYASPGGTEGCTKCGAGTAAAAGSKSCTACGTGSVAPAVSSSCTECKAANHQVPSTDLSKCVNKTCGPGQYVNGVTCTSCQEGTYQDQPTHTSTSCKTCNASSHLVTNATIGATTCTNKYCGANQYIDGNTCKSCPVGTYHTLVSSTGDQNTSCSSCPAGCSSCTSATVCTDCTGNYTLSADGKCVMGCNPQIMILSGTTVQATRFNMGDDPQCPRSAIEAMTGVTFVPVGTNCTGNYCCWYGATSGTSCSDQSGGIYSGCNRTVCKWYAGDKICKSLGEGWQMPGSGTIGTLYKDSTASTGLMLCDESSDGAAASLCAESKNCPGSGSTGGGCGANWVWSASVGTESGTMIDRYLRSGSWKASAHLKSHAHSIRCIKKK